MATLNSSTPSTNSSFANFAAWAAPISAALLACGWVQQNDTGQVVWSATTFVLTQATVSGGNVIYAFSSWAGTYAPRIGMSVVISGFTNGGNNLTATITALTGSTSGTFTVVNGSGVNETHAGAATTTANTVVPGTSAFVYEIWATADALSSGAGSMQVFLKVEYGTSAGNASIPSFAVTIGLGTNGSGALTSPSARMLVAGNLNSATLFNFHASGDAGNFSMLLWAGSAISGYSSSQACFLVLERSHDNNGADTATYYTICLSNLAAGMGQQTLFPSGAQTTNETAGFSAIIPKTATTGNFGTTTHVCGVFPLVGGPGNPMKRLLLYRATDFADSVQINATLYNTARAYISAQANVAGMSSVGASTPASVLVGWF